MYHHESNGHAKYAVREDKKLLAKTTTYGAFRQALRNYRNCPRYDGLSPAQRYFGRRQCTEVVAFPSAYNRIPEHVIANHEFQRRRKTGKLQADANKSLRPKTQMHPGQHVIAQQLLTRRWDQRAEILENRNNGQTYLVRINGRGYLRNRRFLRPLPNPQQRYAQHATPAEIPETYQKTGGNDTREPKRTYQKREFKPARPLRRPQPIEQNATPNKIYPQCIRQQQMRYQAAVSKPKRRNRPTAY